MRRQYDIAQEDNPFGKRGMRRHRGAEPPIRRDNQGILLECERQIAAIVDRVSEVVGNGERGNNRVGVQ